jgi:hypothetical protein
MGLLHMITADPARTPTFTMFGLPDYWFASFGSPTPTPDPGNAWNHGGIQPEITTTFLGLVGPGVLHSDEGGDNGKNKHGDDARPESDSGAGIQFSDHTDIRPTILALLGLKDDYSSDGRVLIEALNPGSLPHSLADHQDTLLELGRVYKMINAPLGDLGRDSLKVSTAALASNTTSDAMYTKLEAKIANWHTQRDAIASQMKALLEGAAFSGDTINEGEAMELISQGEALLDQVSECAEHIPACAQ